MLKSVSIPWQPFSDKHKRYIKNALKNRLVVAEGAIRSGKSIDNCIIFSAYLEDCPDVLHLASGSTLSNAKLNIGDCNGFGLEHLFRGRCRWGKYKDAEALYINTRTGQKVVIFTGGGKADSYKKILGNSFGGWIATEINEHYDCDDSRTSFIMVARARQVASLHPLTLWDLNPSNPNARIYTEYIDRYKENGLEGGYLYEHFTIKDNLSITPQRLKEIESLYNPSSVFYKRDILGQRVTADGIIYQEFCNNEQDFYITREEARQIAQQGRIFVGQDFGGNHSKHTFCATLLTNDYQHIYTLMSEEHEGTGTNVQFVVDSLEQFCRKVEEIYQKRVDTIFADSAEQTIINTERGQLPNRIVRNSDKGTILDRIRAEDLLFTGRRIHIVKEDNESLIQALRSATWDSKSGEDKRLDNPPITNICPLDAFEYSWCHYIRYITRR